ncbi:hypothetical protein N7519_003847 [Penicillium mononematosum]|nr:hypothetical protein N7519_003847 [Penicillium mononematosum]
MQGYSFAPPAGPPERRPEKLCIC